MSEKKYKIYSIQVEKNQSGLIEIESLILKGLYRFSILGINQRYSSDIKDRVYSALRSQKLINLKSDNKKITVNLLPTDVEKKSNIYDLGIALGCLCCMDQIIFNEDVLVMGELSILGNIIPTGYILKSIYQSIKNNIKIIICSDSDLKNIVIKDNDLIHLILKNNIKFITGETLSGLISNIKNGRFYIFTEIENKNIITYTNQNKNVSELKDNNILKIILSLCTGKNIFIEKIKDSYIQKFITNLIYYNQKINTNNILKISDILTNNDTEILHKYTYPIISKLDNQSKSDDLVKCLNESTFGFNIIDNFINTSDESFSIIKNNYKSSIICFYDPCPCGNNNIFFDNYHNDRCFCLQRNILRYKQKLHRQENGFFDFYIDKINQVNLTYTVEDYININNIINTFKDIDFEISINQKSLKTIQDYSDYYEIMDLKKIIIVVKDLKKLMYIITKQHNNDDTLITKQDIDFVIDLLKKDF